MMGALLHFVFTATRRVAICFGLTILACFLVGVLTICAVILNALRSFIGS